MRPAHPRDSPGVAVLCHSAPAESVHDQCPWTGIMRGETNAGPRRHDVAPTRAFAAFEMALRTRL
jgi:hypothetical protein